MKVPRTFLLVATGALCLWAAPVREIRAVAKEKTISGLPPNTAITIQLPDGTTEEKETNDDGKLVFPFPKGKSTLSWPGGSKVVKGGWTAATTGGVIGASIAGATAVTAAADSDSNPADPPPRGGTVEALRVDNPNTASLLGVNVGDTIPLSCIDGEDRTPPDVCSCEHAHGTIGVPVLSRTATDTDPGACGHGCIVMTSNPTITC